MAKINIQKRNHWAPKLVSFLVIMMLFLNVATAQNEGQFTHFMYNRLSYNPAYAGSSGGISGTLLYRNQWMGLKLQAATPGGEAGSTPTDILFSFDMPVKWLHGGVGVNFISEEIGFHKNNSLAIDYAFRIFWGPGNLSAAIEANLYSYQFASSNLTGHDPNDPLINAQDESDFVVDFSTGLYYQVPGLFYVSLSVKNLLASRSEAFNMNNVRTFYLMGGYEYTFPYNPSFKIKPSALLKSGDMSIVQLDLACLLDYENTFWAGLGYRGLGVSRTESFNFLAGINFLKIMQFGVAYDLPMSKLSFGSGRAFGSLEFYVNANFQIDIPKRPPTVSGNTLYLK